MRLSMVNVEYKNKHKCNIDLIFIMKGERYGKGTNIIEIKKQS